MKSKTYRWQGLPLFFMVMGLFLVSASAQEAPILVSHPDSTRALSFEAVSQKREPFPLQATVRFGSDAQTRVVIFAKNLQLQPGETASAVTARIQDANGSRAVMVEYVGILPEYEWATAVILRLPADITDVGDVLVGITYHNMNSNRVRLGIGHTGGGPPDDPGAAPTPGNIGPLVPPNPITAGNLNEDDVRRLISQAVSAAVALNQRVTVAVSDKEGNVLGVFQMTNAPTAVTINGGGTPQPRDPITGLVPVGLENTRVANSSVFAAIAKANTAAYFSTQGNAFTPRTASFIIQSHIPPGVDNTPGGPLFGVQFSSLPCSDIKRQPMLGGFFSTTPLGLAGDPGAMPVYKNGVHAGGIGIEGDGAYGLDLNVMDFDQPFEENIAFAAVRGFDTPALIRGDNILVNGIRLPFINIATQLNPPQIAFAALPGQINAQFPIRPAQPSQFVAATVNGISGGVDPRFFPFRASPSGGLTAADVQGVIGRAAQQASITRAAIRQPLGSPAHVSISVVDRNGEVLGIFRTSDAPVFGFDVSVQKARGAAFFSRPDAATLLNAAGFGSYVTRAVADGLPLNGSIALTTRAVGFVHRPFYPDDINGTPAGALSAEIPAWSPFNVGLQLDLIKTNFQASILGANVPCSSITVPTGDGRMVQPLANGTQIFAGSVPLYKNGALVGAIGISGDGIDQDDIIASAGSVGLTPPVAMRSDQFFVRGARLPFVKFPRSPNL
jgi:uncharacterized protein GlcG (DUF336 family)